ncbi:MAG: AAA family ATPase [Chlamydiae bacterium]|nr:AAA family ATPase [Chlamydiota bacterium]MBI3266824.1 AAA family ATPase [Chlamydiota bacterium]
MYHSFYGLKENPFNITPDPHFFFFSRQHQEALSALTYGIEARKGFIEITGEVGSGKTTLCRRLLSSLEEKKRGTKTALILNPQLSDLQMLRTIVEDFGIVPKAYNKKDLFDALNRFLLEELSHGNNVVLIIDESQNLRPAILEQIRMLSNLETDKEKLLQIVLVGQPELHEMLLRPALRQLRQRISIRYHLKPFDLPETASYIQHRLSVAGAKDVLQFNTEALGLIFEHSGGIPRLINIVCDHTLLAGYVAQKYEMDADLVEQAIAELEGVRV